MTKVLLPVVMLGLCAVVVAACSTVVPTGPVTNATATATFTLPPEPTAQPNPIQTPSPSPASQPPAPAVGEQAPDFTLPSSSGDRVTLSDYRGQENVVLLFYRTGG